MRFLTHRQHLAHDGSCKGFVKSPYQQELEEIHVKRFHRKYHSTYCDRRYRARVDDPSALAQAPQNTTATSKPPAEIQSLIDAHINAFNTQDNEPGPIGAQNPQMAGRRLQLPECGNYDDRIYYDRRHNTARNILLVELVVPTTNGRRDNAQFL
jgi:hypothetical protein